MVYLDSCKKCGCAVFAGTHYCKDCASETGDWTGYTDLSDFPVWLLKAMVVAECCFAAWLVYWAIRHCIE